jgi:superfamily II DNA/RNA helicase
MAHHVLHVRHDDRFDVLVDLVAAPGRSVVFTRTKRRAKTLTRQLIQAGVPAVELHGNLAQNARNRNLSAFSDGSAQTLVATDIAARGIHVDDIALVIHADPPIEHKAYLHRSGRTARAGAQGTVITLMTDDQQSDVRDLTRKAGIRPTTTRTRPGDALLAELAPGERTYQAPSATPAPAPASSAAEGRPRRARPAGSRPAAGRTGAGHEPTGGAGGRGQGGQARGRRGGPAQSRSGQPRIGQPRTGQPRTGSTPVHTSQSRSAGAANPARSGQSGGVAAFSSGTRAGRRGGR